MKRLTRVSLVAALLAAVVLTGTDLLARRAVTTTIRAQVGGAHTAALDAGTASFPFGFAANYELADGVAANQANRVFTDTRTLAASGTEDLDLAGVLTDAYGATITFAKIKALYISAASGNTNNVVLSRPAANGVVIFSAAADAISILPGGSFLWVSPNLASVAVTAGTGDLLTLTNSAAGTAVTYSIVIIGTSS